MKHIKKLALALCTMSIVMACSPSGEKVEIKSMSISLMAEGPLYDGINTAISNYEMDWSTLLGKIPQKVNGARIKGLRIKGNNFDIQLDAAQYTLQMAAPGVDMAKIAFLNSAESSDWNDMKVAENQKKIEKFFNSEIITFVLDFDYLEEETYDDLEFGIEIDLELTVKL